jgi:hypothetical protein
MSTSALSNSTLSYTYTTVPTFNNTMVGYSDSNNTLLATLTTSGATAINVLSIQIDNPGVYLCEGSIAYSTNTSQMYVFCSLSTVSATLDTNNEVNVFTSAETQTNLFLRTTAVITISTNPTTLYCVGQSGYANQTIAYGFIKYTRIA